MNKVSIFIFLSLLVVLSAVAGCTKTETIYVCPSGKTVISKDMCKTNKVAGIDKKDAEKYAQNFVRGYVTPYGGRTQLVSTYLIPDQGDYESTFIISVEDISPFETKVIVDGITARVNCSENCMYIEDVN